MGSAQLKLGLDDVFAATRIEGGRDGQGQLLQRLVALLLNQDFISRLSHAVDEIEKRSQQVRPWKIVTVRRGLHEERECSADRHFAAHPEDRGANIVLFEFYEN